MVSEVCLEWALLSAALWGDLSIKNSANRTFDQSLLKTEINLIIVCYF